MSYINSQKLLYNLNIALEAVQRNKLRALLTSLGIIFGVASVIAMLAIGSGAQQEVLSQMELLGTNNIIIQPILEQTEGKLGQDNGEGESNKYSPGLTLHDIESIRKLIPEVEYISPEIVFESNFIRKARMRSGKIVGVSEEYFDINSFDIIEGNNFNHSQIERVEPVCVIGYDVKTKFFPGENPIGKKIKIGNLWLTVVGVLQKKELSTENIERLGIRNYNLDIFAPITTVILRFKNRALVTKDDIDVSGVGGFRGGLVGLQGGVSSDDDKEDSGTINYHQLDKVIVRVSDSDYSVSIAEVLSRMLKRRHNGVVDYEIIVPEQLLQQEQRTKRIFNIVLSSIASISLIVGGIGIMNIMLASVVERYKEIGLRLAVGAQKKDIELQFLTESLALSIGGGLVGIFLGVVKR